MPGGNTPAPIVIVGSGLAGGTAAKTLRNEGYAGPVILIGDEPGVPFGRPPLSKTYLRGEESLSGWLVEPAGWYAKNSVEMVRDRARSLDTHSRAIELASGRSIPYGRLLIATGGRNRPPAIAGSGLEGVHQLRTVADCDAIKAQASRAESAVIVGMGFIGCEVAASLRRLGLRVSAVFPGAVPLQSVLGDVMGRVFAEIHRDEGVQLVPGDEVARFEGDGKLERALTKGGLRLDCDLAIVAVGIQPNVEWLEGSGVAIDNGVLVDAHCRTSVPDVFAAGDVANHQHPLFGRIRVEHYNNAEKQGAAVARAMAGSSDEYIYLHTFWSDQYSHKLEYVGHVRKWDQFVTRGSVESGRVIGFYVEGGTIRAAVGLDRGGDPELDTDGEMAMAARLIARRARPSAELLADEDTELSEL